jgi:hypothetical protein
VKPKKVLRAIVRLLLWIGLIRLNGKKTRWPVHVAPRHVWKHWWAYYPKGQRVGVFRNRPGIIKYEPGRLLPRRWGFYLVGFEFGDRG